MATLIVLLIVLVGFVLPLRLSLRSKGLIAFLLVLATGKSYLFHIVGGTAFDPNIPYNLSFIFDIGRSLVIFLAILVILRAIINFVGKVVKQSLSYSFLPTHSPFHALIMLIVSSLFAIYGTSCAYSDPELKHYDLTLEKLDPRLDGMKIVLMSDIHISAPTDVNLIYRTVNRVNNLNADLILIPGDLIDGEVELRRPITDLLFKLKAKYGTFISTGNHEYYSGYQAWRNYFEQGGFVSLDNKVIALQDSKQQTLLNLGGITDSAAERFGLPMPDIKGVVSALDPKAPSIILSHRPEFAKELDQSPNVSLILSGHTHGGLVKGLTQFVAEANGGFVSGLYKLKNSNLIVCNGTMIWMGFPLRIGVPPQIEIITLHAKEPNKDPATLLTVAGDNYRQQLKAQKEAKAKEAQASKATQVANEPTKEKANKSEETKDTQVTSEPAKEVANKGDKQDNTETEPNAYSYQNIKEYSYAGYIDINGKAYQDLQFVLPMKNVEDGKVVNNVTNLVVLPANLSPEQLQKISQMIEQQVTAFNEEALQKKQPKNKEIKVEKPQEPVLEKLTFKVIKDGNTPAKEQPKQEAKVRDSTKTESPKDSTKETKVEQVASEQKAPETAQDLTSEFASKPNILERTGLDKKILVTISTANAATLYTEDGKHHIFEQQEVATLEQELHNHQNLKKQAEGQIQNINNLSKTNTQTSKVKIEESDSVAQASKILEEKQVIPQSQDPLQDPEISHISIANALNNEMALVYTLSLGQHPLSKKDENVSDLLEE